MDPLQNTDIRFPLEPPVTCGNTNRNPFRYTQIVRQFAVETNPRYQRRDGLTFCKTFVWDVCRAMCAEIPYWWLGAETNANATLDWLEKFGPVYGWTECNAASARDNANQGNPTIAIWKNPGGGHGHIAMVVPTAPPRTDTLIAQAGIRNFYGEPVANGFGPYTPQVRYFMHQ